MMVAKIKKAKVAKNKNIIKRKIKFDNYKNSSEAIKLDNETKYLEKKIELMQIVLKKS